MTKFEKAKFARPYAIISILIMLVGFVLFNKIAIVIGIVISGLFGTLLLCDNCHNIYLNHPFKFLMTGKDDDYCVNCGNKN